MFGELDTRLGRRWNLDPKPTVGLSPYATFSNNPIWYTDVLLDSIRVNWFGKNDHQLYHGTATHFGDGKNDGLFMVFGHGNGNGIQYERNGQDYAVTDAKSFDVIMSEKCPEWQTALKSGKQITLVLYACNTGANEYYVPGVGNRKYALTIAQKISKAHSNVTVVAPDGYTWYGGNKVLGVQRTTESDQDGTSNGGFVIIKDGVIQRRQQNTYNPTTEETTNGPKKNVNPNK